MFSAEETHYAYLSYIIHRPPTQGLEMTPGSPRHTWLWTLEQDLRPDHLGLWIALQRAQDCVRWRRVVEAATPQEGACYLMIMIIHNMPVINTNCEIVRRTATNETLPNAISVYRQWSPCRAEFLYCQIHHQHTIMYVNHREVQTCKRAFAFTVSQFPVCNNIARYVVRLITWWTSPNNSQTFTKLMCSKLHV